MGGCSGPGAGLDIFGEEKEENLLPLSVFE
jgi:hypothetical protein